MDYDNENSLDQLQSAQSNIIDIPLRDDQEVVTLNLDTDLPDDPTELCDLLENELAGRQYWLAIGTAYSRLGKVEEAIEVVNRGLKAYVVEKGTDNDRLPFYSCLSWLYLKQYRDAPLESNENVDGLKSKAVYQQMATQEMNRSAQILPSWSVNVLARGVWGIFKNTSESLDQALHAFDDVLRQSENSNLLAMMGRANILYRKENYKASLKLYQQVLASRAAITPDPRIGIGLCFWKLGYKEDSKLAWDRSLELDPESTTANALLGIYYQDAAFKDINSPTFVELYGSALQYTQKAYKKTQKLALAGVTLASYLFSKKNMAATIKLCEKVIQYSDVDAITSDGYFWMARAYHHMENYEKAMSLYHKARAAKVDNVLAKIGIGQLQIQNDDFTQAKLTFERVIQEHPKCAEAMLILGSLYAEDYVKRSTREDRSLDKTKSKALLEKYVKLVENRPGMASHEINARLILCRLYEDDNVDMAASSLQQTIELQKQAAIPVEYQILNNIGVFCYQKGDFEKARQYFQNSLEALYATDSGTESDGMVTITYNLGRLEEETGDIEEAKKVYDSIESRFPGYMDVKIRDCYLDLKERAPDGVKKLQALINNESFGSNLEVRALHGWYLHQQKRTVAKNINEDPEQIHYKHSLQRYDKHDVYSLIAIGNIFLAAAREMRPTNEFEAEKRRKTYDRAVEFFDKSLQLDSKNAYAAQGVAIALAECRKHGKAVGIFGKVRETLSDVSVYINLGHCLAELKQYMRSIECYEIALNKYQNGTNIQTISCLGRVLLRRGMEELNLESAKSCLEYTRKALALSPSDATLKFNVAFAQFQVAEIIRRIPISSRQTQDIKDAAEGLEEAIKTLNELASIENPPYPSSDIQQRATMGQNTTRRQLERLIVEQTEYELQSKAKLEAARKFRSG
ncbi:uncharacterized protein V1510DRAFT_411788 [Dipodascopsis tothii]|uniref:uncharacterized protein n=1 Tax=Dipodascopsis tothii TaxID=44089 RepID=UPI0034CD530D